LANILQLYKSAADHEKPSIVQELILFIRKTVLPKSTPICQWWLLLLKVAINFPRRFKFFEMRSTKEIRRYRRGKSLGFWL
jgi:hypothetical protein